MLVFVFLSFCNVAHIFQLSFFSYVCMCFAWQREYLFCLATRATFCILEEKVKWLKELQRPVIIAPEHNAVVGEVQTTPATLVP